MTGRDAVEAMLRLIGAAAPGESIDASEASDALDTINRMISGWSNEGVTIYQVTEETPFTLTAGDGSITMGTSGDFSNRPQEIVRALIRDGTTDYPVRILNTAEYAAIQDKSTQSTHPQALYEDGGFPQRTLKLWPVPSAAKSLVLFTKRVLTSIATLDTSVSFPPGYDEMIIYHGAIRLAPEYGKSVSPEVVTIADRAMAGVMRANHRPSYLRCDAALAPSGNYNIMRGDA